MSLPGHKHVLRRSTGNEHMGRRRPPHVSCASYTHVQADRRTNTLNGNPPREAESLTMSMHESQVSSVHLATDELHDPGPSGVGLHSKFPVSSVETGVATL